MNFQITLQNVEAAIAHGHLRAQKDFKSINPRDVAAVANQFANASYSFWHATRDELADIRKEEAEKREKRARRDCKPVDKEEVDIPAMEELAFVSLASQCFLANALQTAANKDALSPGKILTCLYKDGARVTERVRRWAANRVAISRVLKTRSEVLTAHNSSDENETRIIRSYNPMQDYKRCLAHEIDTKFLNWLKTCMTDAEKEIYGPIESLLKEKLWSFPNETTDGEAAAIATRGNSPPTSPFTI